MPKLSQYFLRGGFLCLALGLVPGGLILLQKGTGWYPSLWVLLPGHIYLVLIGGLSQITLGMSYWMLPRLEQGRGRGRTGLAWSSYLMLNSALLLMISHPLLEMLWGPWVAPFAFTGTGVLQSGAAVAFVLHTWPRIRPGTVAPGRSR